MLISHEPTPAQDELLWAAAWLFEATDDQYYLKYVIDNSAGLGGTGWAVREFSWDNKYAGLQVLLTKVYQKNVQVCILIRKQSLTTCYPVGADGGGK